MIFDSHDWKAELKKHIIDFKRYMKKRKIYTDSIDIKIESFFFITCFIVRKIYDSNKLSDEVEALTIPVNEYANIKPFRWFIDRYDIDEHFDLNKPKTNKLDLRKLVNLGIHSFSFVIKIDSEKEWHNVDFLIYINTDFSKNKYLYEINTRHYIEILNKVINDDIVSAEAKYDEKLKEMKYISKSNK